MTVYVKDYDGNTIRQISSVGLSFDQMKERFGIFLAIMLAKILSPARARLELDLTENSSPEPWPENVFWTLVYQYAFSENIRTEVLASAPCLIQFSSHIELKFSEEEKRNFSKFIKGCRNPDELAGLYITNLPDFLKEKILRRICWLMDPSFN